MDGRERDRKRRSIRVRSKRRGMRELDLLIGRFVDECLAHLPDAELEHLEALLFETDVSVFNWITGMTDCPDRYRNLISEVRRVATKRAKPC